MGLAAAYRAAKIGHEVDLIEAAPEPGGMAGHFDFDGVSLERFYHFVCKTDYPTFDLLMELGLSTVDAVAGVLDGRVFRKRKAVQVGRPHLTSAIPASFVGAKGEIWPVCIGLGPQESVACDRERIREELDRALVWLEGVYRLSFGSRCSITSSTSTRTTYRRFGYGHGFAASGVRAAA